MSFGFLVGGLVQAVSGKHLRHFVHSEIAMPLGMASEFKMGLDGMLGT